MKPEPINLADKLALFDDSVVAEDRGFVQWP